LATYGVIGDIVLIKQGERTMDELYPIIISQINALENAIIALPKELSPTERRKQICQWTYNKRQVNPEFAYWSVLNSGPAGETLAMSPLKSQKYLYSLIQVSGAAISAICDFKQDYTEIQVLDCSCIPFKEIYKIKISYFGNQA